VDQRRERLARQLVGRTGLTVVHDLDYVRGPLQERPQRRHGGRGIPYLVGGGGVVMVADGPAVDPGEVRAGEQQPSAADRPGAPVALPQGVVDLDAAAEVHDRGNAAAEVRA
jgi:hypothetical protein